MVNENTTIAVVGLGYVGLPLAVEFGKKYRTYGYDLSKDKVSSYQAFTDPNGEVSSTDLKAADKLIVSTDPIIIAEADVVIVAVPTPVDMAHVPDFSPLIDASTTVGRYIKKGVVIVFESTVYPGATEEVCIPILEQVSGYKWKQDFYVGYSPERVNPGDRDRTITKIVKVVSGDSEYTLEIVAGLYESVISAGVYRVNSIQVAEAAKVIENTQRDLNIALMNELAIIFDKLEIDTLEVLNAAGTKWNFLPFRPGLVGGHCIGVDPYYLSYKADMMGYHPELILAGRRINNDMSSYVAQQTIKKMIVNGTNIMGAKVIVLGLTFKENCSDLRNSKVADLVQDLQDFGCEVYVHDPIAESELALHEYGLTLTNWDQLPCNVDAMVAAVAHKYYLDQPVENLLAPLKSGGVFIDIKSSYSPVEITATGANVWRL